MGLFKIKAPIEGASLQKWCRTLLPIVKRWSVTSICLSACPSIRHVRSQRHTVWASEESLSYVCTKLTTGFPTILTRKPSATENSARRFPFQRSPCSRIFGGMHLSRFYVAKMFVLLTLWNNMVILLTPFLRILQKTGKTAFKSQIALSIFQS